MAEEKANEVAQNLVTSFREANQAIAKSIVAAEERNMKFTQSTFTNAMEVLKSHAEATQALMRELEQQTQKQLETFQKLMRGTTESEPLESYMNFFRAPIAFYQQAFDAAETASRQGLEVMEKAFENFQQAAQQGLETMQKVTRQAPHTTQKAPK
jgi:hypothetical protein